MAGQARSLNEPATLRWKFFEILPRRKYAAHQTDLGRQPCARLLACRLINVPATLFRRRPIRANLFAGEGNLAWRWQIARNVVLGHRFAVQPSGTRHTPRWRSPAGVSTQPPHWGQGAGLAIANLGVVFEARTRPPADGVQGCRCGSFYTCLVANRCAFCEESAKNEPI